MTAIVKAGRTRSRLHAAGFVLVAGSLVGAVTVASLGHKGGASTQLSLSAGTAWFADSSTGDISLLDGGTASRVTDDSSAFPVGDAVDVVQSVEQSGAGAYLIDTSTGTVSRVDGATLTPDTPVRLSPSGDSKLDLVTSPDATWAVIQQGTIAEQVDPVSLTAIGGQQLLPGTVSTPVVTSDGTLWALGPGGLVESFSAGRLRTKTHPASGGTSLLVADGGPVVADASTGTITVLDRETGAPTDQIQLAQPGPGALISGSPDSSYVMTLDPSRGDIQVTDLATRRSAVDAFGSPAGSAPRYGAAVIKGNLIFIPDFSEGDVIVVKISGDQLSLLGQIGVGISGPFDLVEAANNLWFDQPNGDAAGLITGNLSIAISKTAGNGEGKIIGHLVPPHTNTVKTSTSTTTSVATTTITSVAKSKTKTTVAPPTPPKATTTTLAHSATTVITTTTTAPVNQATTTTTAPPPSTTTTVPPLNTSFSWSPAPQALVNTTVTFTDTTPGAHQDSWTFPGGTPTTSTATNPTVTWSTPGTYTVKLVTSHNGSAGSAQNQINVVTQTINNPQQITTGPDGNLWYTNTGGNSIGRITPSGVVTNYTGSGINSPFGITAGPKGSNTIWFTNQSGGNSSKGSVGELNTSTGVVTIVNDASFNGPNGIALGADGNLWVTNYGGGVANNVDRVTPSGTVSNFTISGLSGGGWIIAGPNANLWFTGTGASVWELNTSGTLVNKFTNNDMTSSADVAAGPDGNLWFAVGEGGDGTGQVWRMTSSGIFSSWNVTQAGDPLSFIAAGPNGNLWFTDSTDSLVGQITTAGTITTYTGAGISEPEGIADGPDGAVWFTDLNNDSIGRITTSGVVTNDYVG